MQQFYRMIDESFNVCEFSPAGILTDINQNMLKFFEGLTKKDFVGKSMEDLVGKDEKNRVLSNLIQGKNCESVHAISAVSGQSIVFRHKFMPLCNRNSKLLRILMLSYPENN